MARSTRHKGEVVSVRAHHTSAKHAVVEVAHGRRSPKKKGKGASVSDYDDRPTSSMVIPKSQAGSYGIGRKVMTGIQGDPDGDGGETLEEMGERLKKARRS